MRILNSVFPGPAGNLVIGDYPYGESINVYGTPRQEFCVFEMVDRKPVWRAAGSLKHALKYMGPNRWLVFPDNFTGDSSFIYH